MQTTNSSEKKASYSYLQELSHTLAAESYRPLTTFLYKKKGPIQSILFRFVCCLVNSKPFQKKYFFPSELVFMASFSDLCVSSQNGVKN